MSVSWLVAAAAAATELRFDCCAGKNEKFSEISWQLWGLESA